MTPFFSIIIPTFNRAPVLSRAVNSVISQSFQDFEIIVVDDGSTDDTEELCYKKYSDIIRYERQQNAGVCAARNRGAQLAVGQYLIFLDSDDRFCENTFQEYHKLLKNNTVKLLLGYAAFESNGKITKKILPLKNGDQFQHPLTGAFVIDRNLFINHGGYDVNLSYSETSDLFLRLSLENRVKVDEIETTYNAGVMIEQVDSRQRKMRYGIKKYESVKYFLKKHKSFFETNTKQYLNFKRLHAMCALQNDQFAEARTCLWQVVRKTPFSVRSHLHLYFVLIFPRLAKYYYSR